MDHTFVFNTSSLPANNPNQAFDLLRSSMKGMLAVGQEGDRYAIYCDGVPNLGALSIAESYTYNDFLHGLVKGGENDLAVALFEIVDKSPMIENITNEVLEQAASSSFYFDDEPYSGSIDFLAVAWELDAVLLSLATSEKWESEQIRFAQYTEGLPSDGPSYIQNISSEQHGINIRGQYERIQAAAVGELYHNCVFSADFNRWNDELPEDLKARVGSKLALASGRNFQGGKPLFDTLDNADGMREMRFSAVQGGAVRILFGSLSSGKQAVLVGFIKKSDTEGYAEAIKAGKKLWTEMKGH
jgi:hypothetical protein